MYSKNWHEHTDHVRAVLRELGRHGLTAKPSKSSWGMSHVEYLGHMVGNGVVAVPEMRVRAMSGFVQPMSKKDMRAFLGAIGYYCHFIPHFSSYSSLLTLAIYQNASGKAVWTTEMLEAFGTLRSILCSVCALHVPVKGDCFTLHTDASAGEVGAVLNVVDSCEGWRSGTRRQKLKDLRFCVCFIFFSLFVWQDICCVTDHKALVAFQTSKVLNRRLQGWTLKLQDYDFEVVYRKGSDNGNTEGLSRQASYTEEDERAMDTQGRVPSERGGMWGLTLH